ncbi:MAG: AMP-binding protein [Acidimicrobiaceae bacterium]
MIDSPTVNLSKMLRWNVVRRGDKEALVDEEKRWSFLQLDQSVDAHAHALSSAGVGKGDLVGIVARNSATYLIEIFALARIGAILVPLNFRLHARELSSISQRAGISLILCDDEFSDKVNELLTTGLIHRAVLHSDNAEGLGRNWFALGQLLSSVGTEKFIDAEVSLSDVQRILYTSGTTSLPKGVIQTYGNILFNQLGQILELELTAQDRILISAPLFHVSGLEAPGHHALAAGATVVMTHSYVGKDVIDLCVKERITGMVLAAQILLEILDIEDLQTRELFPLRYCIFGGVPKAVRRRFGEAFPGVRMVDTFGMTELTNGAAYMDQSHEWAKLGAAGTVFPYTEIKIVEKNGSESPVDTVGEIVARGPKVSPGYWKDLDATDESWRDGWFHTGDMASMDEDGYIWFASREKDMIRSGGENVASAEIEQIISEHHAVAEVAVIGIPDPRWDEVPKAYVVLRIGATLSEQELIDHCKQGLGGFKVPKEVEFRDSLPRNDSGKILKRELRAELEK